MKNQITQFIRIPKKEMCASGYSISTDANLLPAICGSSGFHSAARYEPTRLREMKPLAYPASILLVAVYSPERKRNSPETALSGRTRQLTSPRPTTLTGGDE